VQTAVVLTGSQAVRLDRGANSNIRWGVPLTGYPITPLDQIIIDWDMRVQGPAGNAGLGQFGPFMGVESYAQPGGGFTLLGSLGIDATTGEVLYQDTTTGNFVAPGPTVAFGAWNHFTLLLDYALKQYSILLNNAILASGIGFVDGPFSTFSDADISGITAAAGSEGIAATAYFDNFVITTQTVVPEPISLAVWALIAVGIAFGYSAKRLLA
jgi:hypothetical protein